MENNNNPNPIMQNVSPMTGSQIPSANQIFKEAVSVYKMLFKTLIIINLIPLLAMLIFVLLAGVGIGTVSTLKIQSFGMGTVGVILAIIVSITLIYLNIWSGVATLFAIKDQTEEITWKEAYKRSKNKVWTFFFTSLLAGLAIIGGLILLIVPGIIFAFWFGFNSFIVVEENLSGVTALKKSKYYVKGRVMELFKKMFFIGIISLLLYIIVGIITSGKENNFSSLFSTIISLFWSPLVVVYSYLVFRYFKSTRP